MRAIPFTDRELKSAWRDLSSFAKPALQQSPKNPHRLLLFYAVECGLKAVWLRRRGKTVFDSPDINEKGHDLEKILKDLNVGSKLSLPKTFELRNIADSNHQVSVRNRKFSEIHQAWRYGGESQNPSDQECQSKLQDILNWIDKELT